MFDPYKRTPYKRALPINMIIGHLVQVNPWAKQARCALGGIEKKTPQLAVSCFSRLVRGTPTQPATAQIATNTHHLQEQRFSQAFDTQTCSRAYIQCTHRRSCFSGLLSVRSPCRHCASVLRKCVPAHPKDDKSPTTNSREGHNPSK